LGKRKRTPEQQAAKRAAQLKRAGKSPEEIAAQIEAEFGSSKRASLREEPQNYTVIGTIGDDIEQSALAQLELALRLPIAVSGALMPDAHPGYALPIGGVFAAHRAVAPAMIGVDIGCSMYLTIFDEDPESFLRHRTPLFADLQASTVFGLGEQRVRQADHAILEDERWELTNQTRSLRGRAAAQLGSSGSGNHFAELVVGERKGSDADNPLPERFCALLTHSGSRGVGYAIARHYMQLATAETAKIADVPKMYEWLDLESEAGQEYWQAMELAGDYAIANHEVIHSLFARRAGLKAQMVIHNRHNFAWKHDDVVIHRKGATPAEAGRLGIIPGSMASASYLVRGLGSQSALWSASHGAGRKGSRNQIRNSISLRDVRKLLKQQDILVEGLSVEESPQAYKDISRVIQLQVAAELIEPIGTLRPIAVIMAGEPGDD